MEITYRKMTSEETNQLQRQLITVWGFIEKIGIKWIGLKCDFKIIYKMLPIDQLRILFCPVYN